MKSWLSKAFSLSHPSRPRTTHVKRRPRPLLIVERLEDRTVPTLMLSLQEAGVNGGAPTVVATGADFTSAQFTGTYGDFRVAVFGGVTHNGAALSFILSSTTSVQNIGASAATLNLIVFQDNFTLPAGSPLSVESGLGGTVNTGALSLANIFQASASSTNNTTFDFTNGLQTATPTGSTFQTGSATGLFNRSAGNPYALSSTAAINLSAGGQINYTSHVNVRGPAIQIVKLTNGSNNDIAPGLQVPVGTPITWTYNVTAIGSGEPIKNVVVTDDNGTPGNADDFHPSPVLSGGFNVGDTNQDNLLDPTETWQYSQSGPAGGAVAGQYTNVGNVTGNGNVTNIPVTAQNPDNYFGLLPTGSLSGSKLLAVATPGESCRMTGGGSVFTVAGDFAIDSNGAILSAGSRITHGLELHCDPLLQTNNHLEINWGGGQNFHLTNLSSDSYCLNTDGFSPNPPAAPCDTFVGHGTGTFNGVAGATIWFTFTDHGEPGSSDTAAYLIKDPGGVTVLSVGGQTTSLAFPDLTGPTLTYGNHQFHKEHAASFSGGTTETPWTIPGVYILLLDANQTHLIASTTLDGSGHFQFSGLVPGTTYVIAEEFPAGYTEMSPTSGTQITWTTKVGPVTDLIGPLGYTVTVTAGPTPTPLPAPFINELTPIPDCRWTGGGSIFTAAGDTAYGVSAADVAAGTRITHGFELHCDLASPNNLEINWGGGQNFHLTTLTNAFCFHDPNIGGPTPPRADCNTIIAAGIGRFNNADGYNIEFTFTDQGEPGRNDTASYLIWKDSGLAGDRPGIYDPGIDTLVLSVGTEYLTFGNQQAHRDTGVDHTGLNAVSVGQFASTSFWSNSKGQAVIQSFNGSSSATALGTWMASNFPNLFGNAAGPMGNLAGKTNAQVAQLYKNLSTSNANGSSINAYAQAAAAALGIYADTGSLGGAAIVANGLAQKYGFAVTTAGGASATISDSSNAPAFGTLSGTALSAAQILAIMDANYDPVAQTFYGGDSVGLNMANNVLSQINSAGNITLLAVGSDLAIGNQNLVSSANGLATGQIWVAIDGLDPTIGGQQEAAIDAAITSLNAQLGRFGATMIDVTANPQQAQYADITIHLASTTAIGGVAQGVLGVTLLGGEVTLVNGWNWYYGADPTQIGATQYDFQTVATHELGHALGLGHSGDANSVMFPYLATGQARRTLTANDLTILDEDLGAAPEGLMAAPGGAVAEVGPSVSDSLASARSSLFPIMEVASVPPLAGPGPQTVPVRAASLAAQIQSVGQLQTSITSASPRLENVNGTWLGVGTFTLPVVNYLPSTAVSSRLPSVLSLGDLGLAPLANRYQPGIVVAGLGGELRLAEGDWDELLREFSDPLEATPFDAVLPNLGWRSNVVRDTEIWTAGTQSSSSQEYLGTAAAQVASTEETTCDFSPDFFLALGRGEPGPGGEALEDSWGEASSSAEAVSGEGGE